MRKQRLQKRKKGKGWSKDHRSNILGEILVFFCSGNYILCHLCLINTVYSVLSTEVSLYKSNCWTITRPMFIIECTDWIWARWDGEEPWAMGGIIHCTGSPTSGLIIESRFFWIHPLGGANGECCHKIGFRVLDILPALFTACSTTDLTNPCLRDFVIFLLCWY